MEIVDKRARIDAEEMECGQVYRITFNSTGDIQRTCIVMSVYNSNISAEIDNGKEWFVDLVSGGVFTVQYNKIIEVLPLKTKLIIE